MPRIDTSHPARRTTTIRLALVALASMLLTVLVPATSSGAQTTVAEQLARAY